MGKSYSIILILGFFLFLGGFAFADSLNWSGYNWNQTQQNGVAISVDVNNNLIVNGTGTNNYWTNEGTLTKPISKDTVQVDIALSDLPASAAGASLWLFKDSQNALIIEKHRDTTSPQYNTNVFVVEEINGTNNFKYVSPDAPSTGFDTYKIKKTASGYEVYYNGAVVYSGTLDLSSYSNVELAGLARASGDQINAQFKNYLETSSTDSNLQQQISQLQQTVGQQQAQIQTLQTNVITLQNRMDLLDGVLSYLPKAVKKIAVCGYMRVSNLNQFSYWGANCTITKNNCKCTYAKISADDD